MAVEFTLLAPMLIVGLLFSGILGVRAYHWINVEQILAAGVEAAARDPGQEQVLTRMQAAAQAKGYVLSTTVPIPDDELFLFVARNCSCPETLDVAQANCAVLCPSQRPVIIRYTFFGTRPMLFERVMQQSLASLGISTGMGMLMQRKQVLVR